MYANSCFQMIILDCLTILIYFYYDVDIEGGFIDMHITLFSQVILTVAEHHSAIVPWQCVAQKTGAVLKYVSLNEDEVPDVNMLKKLMSSRTKLVVLHHVSNVLGMFMSLDAFCICHFLFLCYLCH